MKAKNYKEQPRIREDIEPLYISAFPEEERPPVDMFFDNALKEDNELLGFYENDEFIGFTNVLFYKDLCYVFFLAIAPVKRKQGYGSSILKYVTETYKEKRFVLCFEEVDEKYEDNSFRIKRRDFYYRNGFKDNKLKTCEYWVRYDTVYCGDHPVTFEEYLSIMVHCYGELAKKYIKKAS